MNIQEYISSGIVESYVLGLADEAEMAEFERMCIAHPEVRQAKEAYELELETFSMENQMQPPERVKGKIMSIIDMEGKNFTSATKEGSMLPPVPPPAKNKSLPADNGGHSKAGVKRIPLRNDWQRYIAAASVILLILSTILNFYFFNRYKEYNNRYQTLVQSQSELASHNQILETRLLEYEKAVEWMKDPNMAIIKMPAIDNGPDPNSATTVYWDTRSKDVYLAINNLPPPSADHQYQLWAMVDGKPMDAGVFDIGAGAGMLKMKNIPKAEAFAVTLEKKGGSETPTLERLYVMGKV